jgi:hypothetical protein
MTPDFFGRFFTTAGSVFVIGEEGAVLMTVFEG